MFLNITNYTIHVISEFTAAKEEATKLKQETETLRTDLKKKLTLSVAKDVIEKAKMMDLNISEITENILRTFTYEPTKADDIEILNKYKELFEIMLPILKKFRIIVYVGEVHMDEYLGVKCDIHLDYDGELHLTGDDFPWDDSVICNNINQLSFEELEKAEIKIIPFYPPQDILSNFIDIVSEAVETKKDKLKELEVAKRIIEVIGSSVFQQSKLTRIPVKK